MNARHDPALSECSCEAPSPEEQAEFFNWVVLQEAYNALREGLLRRDPEAINTVRELARLLDLGTPPEQPKARVLPVPAHNRLADGPPPF